MAWHRYRFIGDGGTALPLQPVYRTLGGGRCGTSNTGWLAGWNSTDEDPPRDYNTPGHYPEAADGVVEMTVCFGGYMEDKACHFSRRVGATRCGVGGPLLWRLPYAGTTHNASSSCGSAYCTAHGGE